MPLDCYGQYKIARDAERARHDAQTDWIENNIDDAGDRQAAHDAEHATHIANLNQIKTNFLNCLIGGGGS